MADLSQYTDAQLRQMYERSKNETALSALSDDELRRLYKNLPEEKGAVDSAIGWMRDIWTGEDRGRDAMTEVPNEFYRDKRGLPEKLSLGRTDLQKLEIWNSHLGKDAGEQGFDDFGNAWVTANGQKHFLNAPGASEQDIRDLVPSTILEGVGARFGGRIGSNVGRRGGQTIGTGIGTGTGVAGQEWMRARAGSEDPTDVIAILTATTFGTVGEAASLALGRWLSTRAASRRFYRPGRGWTDEGRRALENAGLDPAQITDDIGEQYRQLAVQAADVDDLSARVRLQEAQSVGVNPTRGRVTQDLPQLEDEAAMRRGGMGQGAQQVITGVDAANEAAMMNNQQAIQRGIISNAEGTPVEPSPGRGEAFGEVQQGLRTARETARRQVGAAYDQAGVYRANLDAYGVQQIPNELRRRLTTGENAFDIEAMPQVSRLLDQLENFVTNLPEGTTTVNFKALEAWRKRLGAMYGDIPMDKKATKLATDTMRRNFDDMTDDLIENALVSGDEETLEAFRRARLLRRRFAQRFESDKMIDKITETEFIPEGEDGGEAIFKLDPGEAGDSLLGRGPRLSPTGRTATLRRIKEILGEDSPQWKRFQEEAFLRLFPAAGDGTTPAQSLTNFKTTLKNLMRSKIGFMRELFTPAQMRQLELLGRVTRTLTDDPPGTVNYSNTAYEVARSMRRLFGNSPVWMQTMGQMLGERFGAVNAYYTARARDLAANQIVPQVTRRRGVVGGLSGLAAEQGERRARQRPDDR